MQPIDPCDAEHSLEDMARQQDNFLRTSNAFPSHVKVDDSTQGHKVRAVYRFMITVTGGRIPWIKEMTQGDFGLRSMEDIDPRDLRMASKMWER